MSSLDLKAGDQLFAAGHEVDHAIFPIDTLMISLLVDLDRGRSVEVASIGKEGAIGGIISCGTAPAFSQSVVQIGGCAIAVPVRELEAAKQTSAHLRNLFCRYSDYLLSQVMQSVACNAVHSIEERAARWLLHTHDRIGGERIALTQETLAELLGVQRTTVNAVVRLLHEQGVIINRRGAIEVRDRSGLSRIACGCYQAVEDHFASVLGASGEGGEKKASD